MTVGTTVFNMTSLGNLGLLHCTHNGNDFNFQFDRVENLDYLEEESVLLNELGEGYFEPKFNTFVPKRPSLINTLYKCYKTVINNGIGSLFSRKTVLELNDAKDHKSLHEDAKMAAPLFKKLCDNVANQTGAKVSFGPGDAFIVKKEGSLKRKIFSDMKLENISYENATQKIGDALRGSIIVEDENQLSLVAQSLEESLQVEGGKITYKNVFEEDRENGYVGIHAKILFPFTNKKGERRQIRAELQMHFRSIFDGSPSCRKERMHVLYEEGKEKDEQKDSFLRTITSKFSFLTGLINRGDQCRTPSSIMEECQVAIQNIDLCESADSNAKICEGNLGIPRDQMPQVDMVTEASLLNKKENEGVEIEASYELAHRVNHPSNYRLSDSPVTVDEYTVNFLWVNLNPQNRTENTAQNIFGDGLNIFETAECIKDPEILRKLEETEQTLEKIKDLHRKASSNGMNLQTASELENWRKIKKSFSYTISKWADVNPNARINLWFDSALVTQEAYKKTFEMMRGISKTRGVDIRMRDIRRLPNISGEIEHSLHPGTPVYYRTDLLKALITDHMISEPKESAKYCVVSDFDIEPMSSKQMFDARTLNYLNSYGYVFNKAGFNDFENNFFIFNKEKKGVQQSHRKKIINKAAATTLELRAYPKDASLKIVLDAQSIYGFYKYFREEMKEPDDFYRYLREEMKETEDEVPRKVVRSPSSQFNWGGNFPDSDYRAESFRFIGEDNIPYTRNGRSNSRYETPIQSLLNWKNNPLETSSE